MELKEFISSTILQIIDGVKEAQDVHKALVNPYVGLGYEDPKQVDFDVAVSVEEKTNAEGGAKINVLGSKLGGGASIEGVEKSITKVKFSVPLKYGCIGNEKF